MQVAIVYYFCQGVLESLTKIPGVIVGADSHRKGTATIDTQIAIILTCELLPDIAVATNVRTLRGEERSLTRADLTQS
jgi:hypothetical protein